MLSKLQPCDRPSNAPRAKDDPDFRVAEGVLVRSGGPPTGMPWRWSLRSSDDSRLAQPAFR
jgi:hypothetical protein